MIDRQAQLAARAPPARRRSPAARRAARSRSDSRDRSRRSRTARSRAAASRTHATASVGRCRRTRRRCADGCRSSTATSGQSSRTRAAAPIPRSSPAARMQSAPCTPGLARALHDAVEIARERVVGEMTVGIDHSMRARGQPSRSGYRDARVPGATSPSKPTSVGLPPSGLAARTMPFDSMPISFAGFRLKTMTMVRPTSCSGS